MRIIEEEDSERRSRATVMAQVHADSDRDEGTDWGSLKNDPNNGSRVTSIEALDPIKMLSREVVYEHKFIEDRDGFQKLVTIYKMKRYNSKKD